MRVPSCSVARRKLAATGTNALPGGCSSCQKAPGSPSDSLLVEDVGTKRLSGLHLCSWLLGAGRACVTPPPGAAELTCNLLHEGHADAVGAEHAALHQLPQQPHQLGRSRREGGLGGPSHDSTVDAIPPPPKAPLAHPLQVSPRPPPPAPVPPPCLCQVGSPPHLGATRVLQLQVLLHEDLVDLVEDDVHSISAHQGQVPVALQQGKGRNEKHATLFFFFFIKT